jgi:hypothetical protein
VLGIIAISGGVYALRLVVRARDGEGTPFAFPKRVIAWGEGRTPRKGGGGQRAAKEASASAPQRESASGASRANKSGV